MPLRHTRRPVSPRTKHRRRRVFLRARSPTSPLALARPYPAWRHHRPQMHGPDPRMALEPAWSYCPKPGGEFWTVRHFPQKLQIPITEFHPVQPILLSGRMSFWTHKSPLQHQYSRIPRDIRILRQKIAFAPIFNHVNNTQRTTRQRLATIHFQNTKNQNSKISE